MLIHDSMNLSDLTDLMGRYATQDQAAQFRPALVREFDGQDTRSVPESRWGQLMIDTCGR